LKQFTVASYRGEQYTDGPVLQGVLTQDLKNFTGANLPNLTAKWCSKYIGPNAPQWINDWVYGFYGVYTGKVDGKLYVPKDPLNQAKGSWVSGTLEQLMEQNHGRSIPSTSDGRLALSPPGDRVGGITSGTTTYGSGPDAIVKAIFDLTRLQGAQKGINLPAGTKIKFVRFQDYWMIYPDTFTDSDGKILTLDASRLFSIFMEMTLPDKFK